MLTQKQAKMTVVLINQDDILTSEPIDITDGVAVIIRQDDNVAVEVDISDIICIHQDD